MATRQLEVVSTPARAASVARQDRRMYRRYDLSLPLTVRRADIGRAVEGRTRDLSSRGVYFLSEDVFVPGCRIDLTVSLARAGLDHPGSFLVARGRVVRVDRRPGGNGSGLVGVAAMIDTYDIIRSEHIRL